MNSRPQPITSLHNPTVRRFRQLASTHGRRRETMLLLEGVRLVETALDAGLHLAEVLQSPRLTRTGRGRALVRRLEQLELWPLSVSERVLDGLSEVATHQGVLAMAARPGLPPLAELAAAGGVLVVAMGLQDPGNLGALIRVADAAGSPGVLCVGGADPWSPRALRGSAGSSFRLPVLRLTGPGLGWLDVLEAAGRRVLATESRAGRSCFELDLAAGSVALLVGSEAAGLDASLSARATPLSVPMREGVDSLNVVAATAVVLYEAVRQRSEEPDPGASSATG